MTRLERTLLVATGLLLVAGGGTWGLLAALGGRASRTGPVVAPQVPEVGANGAPHAATGPGPAPRAGTKDGATPELATPGGGLPTALRRPEGEDLSDPKRVTALLREYLSVEDTRWDWIAQLLGVLDVPLDDDIKWKLQNALVRGNAAGAIQAYERVRDGTVVVDLLRLLDDPEVDAHDRANVLRALGSVPGADAKGVVTGIESRLTGDMDHDAPYLAAIAKRRGPEAARALVDAISRAGDPARFGPDTWRDFDLRKDAAASEVLAAALADPRRSPGALRAIADLAGRPGASPALVDALAALDVDGQDRLVRTQVLASLAATGDDRAIARLIDLATKGADYGSVAARSLADVTAASPEARIRLLETAKSTSDDNLRTHLVTALGNVREAKAVPLLSEWLRTGSEAVRREAVASLGRIGADATPAVESLGAAFTNGDEGLRCAVAITLASIGTPEAKRMLDQVAAAESTPRVKKAIQASQRRLEALQRQ